MIHLVTYGIEIVARRGRCRLVTQGNEWWWWGGGGGGPRGQAPRFGPGESFTAWLCDL